MSDRRELFDWYRRQRAIMIITFTTAVMAIWLCGRNVRRLSICIYKRSKQLQIVSTKIWCRLQYRLQCEKWMSLLQLCFYFHEGPTEIKPLSNFIYIYILRSCCWRRSSILVLAACTKQHRTRGYMEWHRDERLEGTEVLEQQDVNGHVKPLVFVIGREPAIHLHLQLLMLLLVYRKELVVVLKICRRHRNCTGINNDNYGD